MGIFLAFIILTIPVLIKTLLFNQLVFTGDERHRGSLIHRFIIFYLFSFFSIIILWIIFNLTSPKLFLFLRTKAFLYYLFLPVLHIFLDLFIIGKSGVGFFKSIKQAATSFLLFCVEINFILIFLFNEIPLNFANNQIYIFAIGLLLTVIICTTILILSNNGRKQFLKLVYIIIGVLILNFYLASFKLLTIPYLYSQRIVKPNFSSFLSSNLIRQQELIKLKNINIEFSLKDMLDYYSDERYLYFLKHKVDSKEVNVYKYDETGETPAEIFNITIKKPVKFSFFIDNYIINHSTSFIEIFNVSDFEADKPIKSIFSHNFRSNQKIFYTLSFKGKIRVLVEEKNNLKIYQYSEKFKKLKLVKVFKDIDIKAIRRYKIIQMADEKFMVVNVYRSKNEYFITTDFKFYENLLIQPFDNMKYLVAKNYYLKDDILYVLFVSSDNNLEYPEFFIGYIDDGSMKFFPLSFYLRARYYKLKVFKDAYRILMVSSVDIKIITFPMDWKSIDTDKDGFSDFEEFRYSSNYKAADTDYDGYKDIEDTISLSGNKRRPIINKILSNELKELVESKTWDPARIIFLTNYKLSPEYFSRKWIQQLTPEEGAVWDYSLSLGASKDRNEYPEFIFKQDIFRMLVFELQETGNLKVYFNLFGKPILIFRKSMLVK